MGMGHGRSQLCLCVAIVRCFCVVEGRGVDETKSTKQIEHVVIAGAK